MRCWSACRSRRRLCLGRPAQPSQSRRSCRLREVSGSGRPVHKGPVVRPPCDGERTRPSGLVLCGTAVDALRNGEDYSAIAYGEQLAATDSELGAVIATVAAHRLDARDVLNRSLAQMLEVTRFRRFGILPVLHQRIPDVALVAQIGKELAAAGVTPAALGGRY